MAKVARALATAIAFAIGLALEMALGTALGIAINTAVGSLVGVGVAVDSLTRTGTNGDFGITPNIVGQLISTSVMLGIWGSTPRLLSGDLCDQFNNTSVKST